MRCRSEVPALMNIGRIWTEPGCVAAIGRARLQRGRHLVGVITVFRCSSCQLDTVLDQDDQLWTLDPSDYGDIGSWEVLG